MIFNCKCGLYRSHRKDCLVRHIKSCKRERGDVKKSNYTYCCMLCGYQNDKKVNVKQHCTIKHSSGDAKRRFRCLDCTYCTSRKIDLQLHTARMHKSQIVFTCTICKYQARSEELLDMHISKFHTDIVGRVLCLVK